MRALLSPLQFNFHDIVSAQVHSQAPAIRSFFDGEYGYHRSPESNPTLPSVDIEFLDRSASARNYARHTHKLLASWAYQITLGEKKISLRVHGNGFAVPMIHHIMLHPSLRHLAAKNGSLLLHAGAVTRNGKSLIITGYGGAGKTTTTSLLLSTSPEWSLHADDYTFLRPGISLSYLTRSHLYRDLLNWVPEIAGRLTPWERTRLEFLGAVRSLSQDKLKWPVRIEAERLWPQHALNREALSAAILILERGNDLALEPIRDLEATADALVKMNFSEANYFLELLRKTNQLDDTWLSDWKNRERELLLNILRHTPTFLLKLPLFPSPEAARKAIVPRLKELTD